MTDRKLLIDTNVFIGLEDQKEIAPEFAELLQLCNQHSIHVFVHEAALADIGRDRDAARRGVSLSKVRKFEQLKNVRQPVRAKLEKKFGPMPKPNDVVDVALLHALDIGAVDFLVTEDQRIHSRARRTTVSLADRVLTVVDAVAWLRASFEPTRVVLPLVEEMAAHSIDEGDDIFDSLREGYPNFNNGGAPSACANIVCVGWSRLIMNWPASWCERRKVTVRPRRDTWDLKYLRSARSR